MVAALQAGRNLTRRTTTGIRAVRVYGMYWIYFGPVLNQSGPTHMQRHLGFSHASDIYGDLVHVHAVRPGACMASSMCGQRRPPVLQARTWSINGNPSLS